MAELVAAGQSVLLMMWILPFMKDQGCPIKTNQIHQDNKSAILLETNGRASASERTGAINMRCFVVTDHVKKGKLIVECCPMDEMTGDHCTKPLQGIKFEKFRNIIMGKEYPSYDKNAW